MESFDKVHEQLIEEEGIKIADLPVGIQTKIRGWNLLFRKLESNPDDSKLFSSLQKQSVEIADKIQDFIETEFEEEQEEEEEEGDGKPKGDEGKPKGDEGKPKGDEGKPKSDEGKPKSDEGKPKSDDAKPRGFGNLVMEKKILAKINESSDGRIRISELESIIGKEPDYPEQKVHTLTLRKVFMSSDYRIV
jgi:hypothetical protein